jgi:hypothetical protein
MRKLLLPVIMLCSVMLYADIEDDLEGFDDTPIVSQARNSSIEDDMGGFEDDIGETSVEITNKEEESTGELLKGFAEESEVTVEERKALIPELTGEVTQKVSYSWDNDAPHNGVNSFKSELFLDYEHKFDNGYRFKVNAKAYYDAIYRLRDRSDYSDQELNQLESEIELFDAYLEGKISENLDFKIGRQVVVWGRSDTIRVTDILNPLDNRTPAMVDIEDLRLPVVMAKFDYFIGDWRITPIAILEQRFTKNPPFGSDFYPLMIPRPADKKYHDVTYALSIGGEFEGWDINFYVADVHDDTGYIDLGDPNTPYRHDKVQMYGTALNILSGSWLFKSEIAHFEGLKYTSTQNNEFSRTDLLLGFEYNGIVDTMISYDIVSRNIHDYDPLLLSEMIPVKKHTYQHAFRINSEFMNATLEANYLISLFGEKLDEGGYQRLWFTYDLSDSMSLGAGVVDYIGGSVLFDAIEDNDRVFADITYSF